MIYILGAIACLFSSVYAQMHSLYINQRLWTYFKRYSTLEQFVFCASNRILKNTIFLCEVTVFDYIQLIKASLQQLQPLFPCFVHNSFLQDVCNPMTHYFIINRYLKAFTMTHNIYNMIIHNKFISYNLPYSDFSNNLKGVVNGSLSAYKNKCVKLLSQQVIIKPYIMI